MAKWLDPMITQNIFYLNFMNGSRGFPISKTKSNGEKNNESNRLFLI